MQVLEHGVGSVDLVADAGEVVADRANLSAAGNGVLEEPGAYGRLGCSAERAWRRKCRFRS
jgi:hypothetical protein